MPDDILTNADKIERMIGEIEIIIDSIPESAEDKALGISSYNRELAITVLKLKNGLITEMEDWDGSPIAISKITAASDREIIAKGIIYKRAYAKEIGEAGYKGLISILDARKAQLNGLQSINRHLQ